MFQSVMSPIFQAALLNLPCRPSPLIAATRPSRQVPCSQHRNFVYCFVSFGLRCQCYPARHLHKLFMILLAVAGGSEHRMGSNEAWRRPIDAEWCGEWRS